jgi:uncharacterized membrane protein
MHPLVVHFPIGLLLVCPLFVLLGALFPAKGWWFRWTALILLGLGTCSAFVAVQTGEAAYNTVEEEDEGLWTTLDKHKEDTEFARNVFAGLTVVYAVLLVLPLLWKRFASGPFTAVSQLVFLVLLMGGNALLANAAHLGGEVVHKYGVRAVLAKDSEEATTDEGSGDASSEEESAGESSTREETSEPAKTESADQPAGTSDEAKPDEAKPEAKPDEAKPEAKPDEAKPAAEAKPTEEKPAETPAEAKPTEEKPAEAKAENAKPAEAKPAEAPKEDPAPTPAAKEES